LVILRVGSDQGAGEELMAFDPADGSVQNLTKGASKGQAIEYYTCSPQQSHVAFSVAEAPGTGTGLYLAAVDGSGVYEPFAGQMGVFGVGGIFPEDWGSDGAGLLIDDIFPSNPLRPGDDIPLEFAIITLADGTARFVDDFLPSGHFAHSVQFIEGGRRLCGLMNSGSGENWTSQGFVVNLDGSGFTTITPQAANTDPLSLVGSNSAGDLVLFHGNFDSEKADRAIVVNPETLELTLASPAGLDLAFLFHPFLTPSPRFSPDGEYLISDLLPPEDGPIPQLGTFLNVARLENSQSVEISGVFDVSETGVAVGRSRWLPDSSGIAFLASREVPYKYDVYVVDPQGLNLRRLTTDGQVLWNAMYGSDVLTLSANSDWVLFAQELPFDGHGLVTAPTAGGELRTLTAPDERLVFYLYYPEVDRVLFWTLRDFLQGGDLELESALHSVRPDGSQRVTLYSSADYELTTSSVSVSPFGDRLVLSAWFPEGFTAQCMNLDGSNAIPLGSVPDSFEFPTWSADGGAFILPYPSGAAQLPKQIYTSTGNPLGSLNGITELRDFVWNRFGNWGGAGF
jgi:Tol biopolymer transport system component